MKERNSQDHLVSHGLVWLASWWRLYFRMLCQPCARAIIGSPCPDHLALPGRSYYSGHMVPFIQLLCPWPSSVSNATTWPVVFLSLFRACEPSMPPAGPQPLGSSVLQLSPPHRDSTWHRGVRASWCPVLPLLEPGTRLLADAASTDN